MVNVLAGHCLDLDVDKRRSKYEMLSPVQPKALKALKAQPALPCPALSCPDMTLIRPQFADSKSKV